MNVLKYMEDLDNEYSHISSRPNIVTYNSAISILGKANRFEEAKNLFYQVCAVKPQIVNTITYNSFLNALSWRPSRDASHQALSVLKEMNEPNTRTYNTVMKVLSKNKCYDQMEGLLDQMENLSKKRTPLIIPNTITYATLISAYTRSSRPDKISRVMNVLKRMDSAKKAGNEFAVPDTKIYNGILKSNLYSNSMKNVSSLEMNETLENAREIFQIMMSSSSSKCNPDEFTYAVMFQILAKNIPGRNERLEEISNLFMSCREDGMNNGYVLSELRKVIPRSLYQELTR
jgi:pentatricopeptide repeat protein